MTIINVRDLQPEEINHLGDDLARCVRLDHEAAQTRSLACLGEDDVELS